MSGEQQFRITLPEDLAKAVERKVASGEYSDVSEVVQESIRILIDRDISVAAWLDEVAKSIDEYRANPGSAIPSDQVMARIRARSASR